MKLFILLLSLCAPSAAQIRLLCIESAGPDGTARPPDPNCLESPAKLLTPAPGKKIQDTSIPFTWDGGGPDIVETRLTVGRTAGAADVYSGPWGKTRSASAGNIPAGGFIFVTLYSRGKSGAVRKTEYTFESEEEAGLTAAKMMYDMALDGPALRAVPMGAPDPNACRTACAGDPNCRGYTYSKPGSTQPSAGCELKSAAYARVPNNCCVSGLRGDANAVPLRGGNTTSPPPQPPTGGGGNRMPLPPLPPRVPTNPGPVGNIPPPVTLPPSTNTQTAARAYRIIAARGWSDTGIDVQPGMRIEVTAKGTVDIGGGRTADVNGIQDSDSGRLPVPQAGRGALLAKLAYRGGGESQILAVGAQNVLTVEPGEYGRLLFGINDDNLSDNRGEFTITIRW